MSQVNLYIDNVPYMLGYNQCPYSLLYAGMSMISLLLHESKAGGSHSHRTCRAICDRDQNEIKRSRGYLDKNQVIKECFK